MSIELILENETYQQIVKDSFGGVMYSKKPDEYDETKISELLTLMKSESIDAMDGVMSGVFHFINRVKKGGVWVGVSE